MAALDVLIRADILNLLKSLTGDLEISFLLISHDLGVVARICDHVTVMYLGQIVEIAPTKQLFANTRHPYAKAPLSAIPHLDPDAEQTATKLEGEIPSLKNPPPGCKFHTRFPLAQDRCKTAEPEWREIDDDHFVSCHFADELALYH